MFQESPLLSQLWLTASNLTIIDFSVVFNTPSLAYPSGLAEELWVRGTIIQ